MSDNKSAKYKRFAILAFFVVLVGGAAAFWYRSGKPHVTYRELKVERGDLHLTLNSSGTVQPENRLEIKPPVAGRVEEVLVKEGQKVRKGQILAWMSSSERAALLDAARSQGPEEVKKWEDLYKPTPVVAPISGTLITKNVEAGQTFASGESIFTMSNRLTVKAQVDETDISQIRLKQVAEIVLDAFRSQKILASVDQIAFDASTVNNVTTYVVDVLPDKPNEIMRSGMTANVTFIVETRQDVLLVPNSAIKSTSGGESSVLSRGPAGESVSREIKTGLSDGRRTEVISGLSEGDVVLVRLATGSTTDRDAKKNPLNPIPGARRGGGSR